MANLYQLSAAFMACERISDSEVVDMNTGEVLDTEYLDNLEMERNDKLEACACYVKNISADIEAFGAEIARLQKEKKVMENKVERMKDYMANNMQPGETLTTAKCSLSWRKSDSVEIGDGVDISLIPEEAIKRKEPELNKSVLKKLIKEGATFTGITVVSHNNLQIK